MACPAPDTETAPQPVIVVPPLSKLTVPVGMAVDGELALTVAVRVAEVP